MFRDQNQLTELTQFLPGTLLLLPVKITQHAQNHPAVLSGNVYPGFFPKTVDVEALMLHFDPPSSDTTAVDLSNVGLYGVLSGSLNADTTPVESTTLVRGHDLAPLVKPLADGTVWVTWVLDYPLFDTNALYADLANRTRPLNFSQSAIINTGAIRNNIYYACTSIDVFQGGEFPPPNPLYWKALKALPHDTSLLYPYSDYEVLFQAVNSLPTS